MSSRRYHGLTIRLWQIAVLAGIVVAWHLVASLEIVEPVLARSPSEVLDYLREGWANGELWHNTTATLKAVTIAWVLASLVGVIVGISLGMLPMTERVLSPFLDALNSMPRVALAPVFIIYFGISMSAKVALGFSIVVFMVISATRAGVRSADPEVLALSAVLGANKRQLFTKVLLPVAAPATFAVLRLGVIYALLGVVASELMASRDGLGQLLSSYTGTFRLDAVYGILIVLMIISSILNQIMRAIESYVLRWQPPAER